GCAPVGGGPNRCLGRAKVWESSAPARAVKRGLRMPDPLIIAGREFNSRLFLGTAGYPNRQVMLDALAGRGSEMATASIRRISLAGDDESLVDLIPKHIHFLPNPAACQPAHAPLLPAPPP